MHILAHTHMLSTTGHTHTHCAHPYTLTYMLCTSLHTPTHCAHPYTPTLTMHILTHCAHPYTHTVHILTCSLTHTVHILTHSPIHAVHSPPSQAPEPPSHTAHATQDHTLVVSPVSLTHTHTHTHIHADSGVAGENQAALPCAWGRSERVRVDTAGTVLRGG